jgi:periplasmic glucans biosynthesis protein
MVNSMRRRSLLKTGAIFATAVVSSPRLAFSALANGHLATGSSSFDFAWLKGQARALAQRRYQPPSTALPKPLLGLDYDGYQAIRFRSERALWEKEPENFRVQFFHQGPMFREPVRMHEITEGRTREIAYDPSMFDFRKSGIDAASLGKGLGFAGFRLQFHTDWETDVAAFLGASYFRAVGGDRRQYGLSARGLAIDTAVDHAEEFPRFSDFWFARPAKTSGTLRICALLDSPSVAGAYRFDISPGATLVMEVDVALYPRKAIERLGIAPLTSMFLCGENDRRMANDWRPEIHDSDGLSLLTGNGEWIWRPLVNTAGVRVNSFVDRNPRGFGLLQRDRDFDHYQDDGAFYERRPSLWVEPKMISPSGWGQGSVELVELPAPDETYDNIVAFWHPAQEPEPGQELLFSYRLYWGTKMPFATPLAQVVAVSAASSGRSASIFPGASPWISPEASCHHCQRTKK